MKIEKSSNGDNLANVTISGEEMSQMISAVDEMNGILNRITSNGNLNIKVAFLSFYLANVSRWFSQTVFKEGKPILTEDEWADLFAMQAKSWNQQLISKLP